VTSKLEQCQAIMLTWIRSLDGANLSNAELNQANLASARFRQPFLSQAKLMLLAGAN